jgi:hypothetical protein
MTQNLHRNERNNINKQSTKENIIKYLIPVEIKLLVDQENGDSELDRFDPI